MSNSDPNGTNTGSNGPGYIHMPQAPIPSQRFADLERAFHKATLDRKAILASSSTVSSVCSSKAPTPLPAAAKNGGEGQRASATTSGVTMAVSVPPPPPGQAAAPTAPPGILGQKQVQGFSTVPVSIPVSNKVSGSLLHGAATSLNYVHLTHNCFSLYSPRSSQCQCTSLVSRSNLNR